MDWSVIRRSAQPVRVSADALKTPTWEATLFAGAFEPVEVYLREGYDEVDFRVIAVTTAAIASPLIASMGERGALLVRGKIEAAWPTEWALDWDGPRVSTLFSMAVGGIRFDIDVAEAPDVSLRLGEWVEARICEMTVYSGLR